MAQNLFDMLEVCPNPGPLVDVLGDLLARCQNQLRLLEGGDQPDRNGPTKEVLLSLVKRLSSLRAMFLHHLDNCIRDLGSMMRESPDPIDREVAQWLAKSGFPQFRDD